MVSETEKTSFDPAKFSDWLNTNYQISDSTLNRYVWVVKKFFKDKKKLSPENLNKFLKKHPRLYYRMALKRYLEFEKLEWELIRITEPERKPKSEEEEPTRHELEKLLNKIDHKDTYWVYRLLYYTGARVSEILKLRLENIDFNTRTLTLEEKMKKGAKRFRKVVIPAQINNELKIYLIELKGLLGKHRGFFTTAKNVHNAYMRLLYHIQKSKKLTGKEQKLLTTTHNFRSAVINWIIDRFGDITVAKAYVGHDTIKSTEKYISRRSEKEKRKMVEKAIESNDVKKSAV